MSKLKFLNGWGKVNEYITRRSAQSFMGTDQLAFAASGCGSSCGADDEAPKPSSACGAGDDAPKPSACGSGCGAGDNK